MILPLLLTSFTRSPALSGSLAPVWSGFEARKVARASELEWLRLRRRRRRPGERGEESGGKNDKRNR